jgi:hypothetical protein
MIVFILTAVLVFFVEVITMESNMTVKQDCEPVSMVQLVTKLVSVFYLEKKPVYSTLSSWLHLGGTLCIPDQYSPSEAHFTENTLQSANNLCLVPFFDVVTKFPLNCFFHVSLSPYKLQQKTHNT